MKLFEKMDKKTEVSGKDVKKRRRSMEKGSGGADAAISAKSMADVPLPSPAQETKPLEMSSTETATVKPDDTESSPVAETKPSEMSTDEAAVVKDDNTESSAVDLIDTEAFLNSDTVTDKVMANEQSEVVDNATTDICDSHNQSHITDNATSDVRDNDIKVESPQGTSESFPTPSPSKPPIQRSSTDGKIPTPNSSPSKSTVQKRSRGKKLDKSPRIKLDVDSSDESTAVTDQPAVVTLKAIENKVELLEEMPSEEVTKRDSDILSEEDVCTAATNKPVPSTSQPMQAGTKAKTVDNVGKGDAALETQTREVRRSLKSLSTAKLKFGMYSRKPLGSRTWVKAEEDRDITSSSESDVDDDDKDDDSTSDSETAGKPQPHPVNFARSAYCLA